MWVRVGPGKWENWLKIGSHLDPKLCVLIVVLLFHRQIDLWDATQSPGKSAIFSSLKIAVSPSLLLLSLVWISQPTDVSRFLFAIFSLDFPKTKDYPPPSPIFSGLKIGDFPGLRVASYVHCFFPGHSARRFVISCIYRCYQWCWPWPYSHWRYMYR